MMMPPIDNITRLSRDRLSIESRCDMLGPGNFARLGTVDSLVVGEH